MRNAIDFHLQKHILYAALILSLNPKVERMHEYGASRHSRILQFCCYSPGASATPTFASNWVMSPQLSQSERDLNIPRRVRTWINREHDRYQAH